MITIKFGLTLEFSLVKVFHVNIDASNKKHRTVYTNSKQVMQEAEK